MLKKREHVNLERKRKEQIKLDKNTKLEEKQKEAQEYKEKVKLDLAFKKAQEKKNVIRNREKILMIGVPNWHNKNNLSRSMSPAATTRRLVSPSPLTVPRKRISRMMSPLPTRRSLGPCFLTSYNNDHLFLRFKSLIEEFQRLIRTMNFTEVHVKQELDTLIEEITTELDYFNKNKIEGKTYQTLERYRILCIDLSLLIEWLQKNMKANNHQLDL